MKLVQDCTPLTGQQIPPITTKRQQTIGMDRIKRLCVTSNGVNPLCKTPRSTFSQTSPCSVTQPLPSTSNPSRHMHLSYRTYIYRADNSDGRSISEHNPRTLNTYRVYKPTPNSNKRRRQTKCSAKGIKHALVGQIHRGFNLEPRQNPLTARLCASDLCTHLIMRTNQSHLNDTTSV